MSSDLLLVHVLRVFDETIEIAISKSLACKCVANFRELCSSVKHAFEIVLRVVPISGCYVVVTDVEYQSYTRITPRLHPSILLSVQRAFW